MDISKARRVIELEKEGHTILVTLWEGDRISSCATGDTKAQSCETCQGDEEMCNRWVDHLKEKGYQATEIELAELPVEDSLPRFLEEREVRVSVTPVVEEGLETIHRERTIEEVE